MKIQECKFSGKLNKGEHYIDGKLYDNDSHKIFIELCHFEYDINVAVNSDLLKKNVKSEIKHLNSVKFIYCGLLIAFVVLVAFVLDRKYFNCVEIIEDNEDKSIETNECDASQI